MSEGQADHLGNSQAPPDYHPHAVNGGRDGNPHPASSRAHTVWAQGYGSGELAELSNYPNDPTLRQVMIAGEYAGSLARANALLTNGSAAAQAPPKLPLPRQAYNEAMAAGQAPNRTVPLDDLAKAQREHNDVSAPPGTELIKGKPRAQLTPETILAIRKACLEMAERRNATKPVEDVVTAARLFEAYIMGDVA